MESKCTCGPLQACEKCYVDHGDAKDKQEAWQWLWSLWDNQIQGDPSKHDLKMLEVVRIALSQNVPDEPDLTLAYMAGHERGKTLNTDLLREARDALHYLVSDIETGFKLNKSFESYQDGKRVCDKLNLALGDTGETR